MTTPDTAYCACDHLIASHRRKPATKTLPKRRGDCTHMGPEGPCPCRGVRDEAVTGSAPANHELPVLRDVVRRPDPSA